MDGPILHLWSRLDPAMFFSIQTFSEASNFSTQNFSQLRQTFTFTWKIVLGFIADDFASHCIDNVYLSKTAWKVWAVKKYYVLLLGDIMTECSQHCGFLEHLNSQKSVSNIGPHFFNGFLSYLQNSTANSAHLPANFCPALVCPQKATVRIQFLAYFWNPLIK